MSRLAASVGLELRLQARYRVYAIVLIAALLLAGSLGALFTPTQLQFFMPVIVLGGISLTTVFLAGFLVLLERDEGTLDVVRLTPLRGREYLFAKLTTLSGLASVEGLVIALIAFGWGFEWLWLAAAILIRALMGVAIGVWIGLHYTSITRFLLPAIVISLMFDIPVLWYFDILPGQWMYVWPAMPPLILAKAAFLPVDTWELIYAFVYGSTVVCGSWLFSIRALQRRLR